MPFEYPDTYIHEVESRALDDTPAERKCGEVERLMGGFLDGHQDVDGFSIDGAYKLIDAGMSPSSIARWFKSDKPTWDQVCARAEAV